MSRDYGALRLWSTVLVVVGVGGVIFVAIGTIFAMIEAVTLRGAFAGLLFCGPLGAPFSTLPTPPGPGF